MLSLIAKLKKQKEAEEEKQRQNQETAKIYAQYVKSFDGKGGEEPLKFVKSDVYDPSTGKTDSSTSEIFSLGEKNDGGNHFKNEDISASYLSQIEDPQHSFKRTPGSSKTREIDSFIEEIKEKQRAIKERKELHKKILAATTEYERHEISQKLNKIEGESGFNLQDYEPTDLYIGNLSPYITEDVLRAYFFKYGQVTRVRVMPVKNDGTSRQYTSGFVSFMTHEQAEKAKNSMDGMDILKYPCKIGWAKTSYKPPSSVNLRDIHSPGIVTMLTTQEGLYTPQGTFILYKLYTGSEALSVKSVMDTFQVELPVPSYKRKIIDLMAKYVSEGGDEFERLIMENESREGLFSFLYNKYTSENIYYRWRVYSLLQNDNNENWNLNTFKITKFGKNYSPPSLKSDENTNEIGYVPLTNDKQKELSRLILNCTRNRGDICNSMLFLIDNSESAYYIINYIVDQFMNSTSTLDFHNYLNLNIKELKSLCLQRGLYLLPLNRSTIITRLIQYDQYINQLQDNKNEEEEDKYEEESDGSDMDQDVNENLERTKIQEATVKLQKTLMDRALSPQIVTNTSTFDNLSKSNTSPDVPYSTITVTKDIHALKKDIKKVEPEVVDEDSSPMNLDEPVQDTNQEVKEPEDDDIEDMFAS